MTHNGIIGRCDKALHSKNNEEGKFVPSIFFSDDPEDWLDDDHLIYLEGMARDGLTIADMAIRIGINLTKFRKWIKEYPEIKACIARARDVIDYKVENALLKSALGYKKREVKVTTIMRYGKVVEKQKEVLDADVAPCQQSLSFWLTNRMPDKWKRDPDKSTIDTMLDDGGITVSVVRAGKKDIQPEDGRIVEDKQLNVSKAEQTAEPKAEYEEKPLEEDLDYWPDDWEDDADEDC